MIWSILFVLLVFKLCSVFLTGRCKSKVCLVGKTALITGGYSGLGLRLAKELASRGCTVIIADKQDASKVVKDIIKETHNSNISCRLVDFASFKSVRSFAHELKEDIDKLDILVNNIGIADASETKTQDGLQLMMQVNYFSHFLLTHLLLDLLLKSSPSRIISTSSMAAYCSNLSESNITLATLNDNNPLNYGPYANSKLALAIMSKVLSEKLDGTGVTSNVVHPGIIWTDIWKECPLSRIAVIYLWWAFVALFGNKTDGIQTLLYLACADEEQETSGKFFAECTSVFQPRPVSDEAFCKKIWSVSEKLAQLKPEEKVESILKKINTNVN